MMINGVLVDADKSSLKLYKEGSGSTSLPSGQDQSVTINIPHEYGSDKLLWQIFVKDMSNGAVYISPFRPPAGSGFYLDSTLDAINLTLYIRSIGTGGGTPAPAYSWQYSYRILIP